MRTKNSHGHTMSNTGNRISPPEGSPPTHEGEASWTGGFADETAEGFPICQWCGSAITAKDDLVVAVDETGAPAHIAPVGYTAPRTYATFHRDCHPESAEDLRTRRTAGAKDFWNPVNVAVIVVSAVLILIVLYFALVPQ